VRPEFIAQVAGVSLHTARRWKRRGRVPSSSLALLELAIAGELGHLARAWSGFRLHGDQLWTPHGFSVRPGEICAIPYRFAQIAELQRELAGPHQWQLIFTTTTE
jgi:hypothetical protein